MSVCQIIVKFALADAKDAHRYLESRQLKDQAYLFLNHCLDLNLFETIKQVLNTYQLFSVTNLSAFSKQINQRLVCEHFH